jgi:hypothetical protein
MSMSKRRKKKIHKAEPEHKKEEERKEEKTEPVSRSKQRKPSGFGTKTILYLVVVAVVFFAAGFIAGPIMSGSVSVTGAAAENQLIFISPSGCAECDSLEPLAKEVASTLGVAFVKTGFTQEMETPGLVLLYNNTYVGITGFDSEYSLKTQACLMTNNDDLCDEAQNLQPPEQEQEPASEVPKSDRPEAHAFVMSYCPYGLQFLKAYIPVIELLGDKADLEVNFVHYLMHGEKERDENTRMYCIQKEQNDKFTDYLRCFVVEGDHEGCITEVGIDSDALDECMQATDEEFEITKNFEESESSYPPYMVDAVLAQAYGVGGSPTFGINGQQVSVNRSPEAIKEAICAAFNNPPAECDQTLSSTAEAPGLGPIGSGDGGSGSDAQC